MLKKTITYTDYDGESRTEDFYFNLTKAELVELNLSLPGGMEDYITKLMVKKDVPAMAKLYKQIIMSSYGEKSADGRRFIKSDELTQDFLQTEAYSELYIELLDGNNMEKFVRAITPAITDEEYNQAKAESEAKHGVKLLENQ